MKGPLEIALVIEGVASLQIGFCMIRFQRQELVPMFNDGVPLALLGQHPVQELVRSEVSRIQLDSLVAGVAFCSKVVPFQGDWVLPLFVDSAANPPVLKSVRIRLGRDLSMAGASFVIKAALRS